MPIVRKISTPGNLSKISACGRSFDRAIGRIGHERYCEKCQALMKAIDTISANGASAATWVEHVTVNDVQSEPQVSEVETITPIERQAQLDRKLEELHTVRTRMWEIERDIVSIVSALCVDLDAAMQDAEKYRQIQAILRG